MRLILLRHGETDWNRAMRFQGRTDVPLNETGRQQARDAAQCMLDEGESWDAVVTSPLSRARETGQIVAETLGAEFGERHVPDVDAPRGPREVAHDRTEALSGLAVAELRAAPGGPQSGEQGADGHDQGHRARPFDQVGQPQQHEEPHLIRQHLGDRDRERSAAAQDVAPADRRRLHCVERDRAHAQREPDDDPNEAEPAREQERRLPSERDRERRDQGRGQHRADVGRGVADAERDLPVAVVEIGRGRFHRRGGADRFGDAQHHARAEKACHGGRERVRHAGQAPHADADPEPAAQTHAVDEPAGAQKRERGRDLERGAHVGVILIRPAELGLQRGFQERENLPIDVVEHDRDEHHRHDHLPRPIALPACRSAGNAVHRHVPEWLY